MRAIAGLRQLMFPKEFRIAPPVWPLELLAGVERSAESPTRGEPDIQRPDAEDPRKQREYLRLLADLGTGLWRTKRSMMKPGTDQPLEDARRAYRHLESMWDLLMQWGIEIQDHTDALYDPGMAVNVISFEPTAGLGRDRIIETIRPTMYFKGASIQIGQVIVGTPAGADASPGQPAPPTNSLPRE